MSIIEKLKKWYRGVYVPPDMSISSFAYIGHYEKPLLAKLISPFVDFWLKHWQVLFPTILAAAVALFIHFDSRTDTSGKPQEKENHQITGTNHAQTPSQGAHFN
ncbi:hypothetical protein V3O24_08955 [Methylobacter sp. Wu8]|uniref:hypothetical protein n=1 Tax=Methylobacter sp. Wu8 TaxID=3118457 RepID=UPI002F3447FB